MTGGYFKNGLFVSFTVISGKYKRETKNPTNVGLDVVERVNLFNHNHSYPVLPYNRILNPCISDMQIHN